MLQIIQEFKKKKETKKIRTNAKKDFFIDL